MTTTPAPAEQPQESSLVAQPYRPVKKVRLKVEVPEGSKLSCLMALLPRHEAEKKAAEDQLSETKKAIQAEVVKTIEDPEDLPDVFDLPADPYGAHGAYTLSAREGAWSLDTELMKSTEPETYVKFARKGRPFWELRRVQRNRVKR